MSAQICSLSLNSAPFCLVTMTGAIHAALLPAGRRGDVVGARHRDRRVAVERVWLRELGGDVGVVQALPVGPGERPVRAGRGPKASSGSPLDTSPFSKYHGRVPIGPTVGHAAGVGAGGTRSAEALRADKPV